MNKINYDFGEFHNVFESMRTKSNATPDELKTLKYELNRFFDDSTCKDVLYTNNLDNMFFGIKIVPMIDADEIYEYLADNEKIRIESYIVEIDSKLLNPIINLSKFELTAILLEEVAKMVGDSTPMENARNALTLYLSSNRTHIKISQSVHYKELLAYGLKDYLSKSSSLFYTDDITDLNSDEFAISYGLVDYLISGYNKIKGDNLKLYQDSEISKFIVFSWALSLYNNIKIHRVGALKTLARSKSLTGSRLEKMEIDNVIRRIQRIDDSVVLEAAETTSGIRLKIKEKLKKARLNNLRTIDSTFYELSMQVRNVEDEHDALYLMRQINNCISIIDEYKNLQDCDEYEQNKWKEAYDKFVQLRDKLSSTVVYKNKHYGIFVNYPDIVENRY